MVSPNIPMPPPARTGGDTALPMRDVIRMATDGIHYLVVFDEHTERPVYLGRQTRIATADQRIICYAEGGGGTDTTSSVGVSELLSRYQGPTRWSRD